MPNPTYRAGDAEDFDRLYRDSYHRVLRTLIGMLGERAAAEDCTQEAFVHAYQRWGSWRGDGPAEAWLHRIAIRVAISHQRHQRLGALGSLLQKLGRPHQPAPVDDAVTTTDALLGALRRIPPQQAAALVLRHHHGYSNREIALSLGIPESTVASRLAMAKRSLAALLDEPGEAEPSSAPTSSR